MDKSNPNDPIPPELLAERKRKNEQLRGNYDLPHGAYFLDHDAFRQEIAYFGTTANTPHQMVEFDGSIFFIAKLPEGDFVVHSWNASDTNGYNGTEIRFLLNDGTLKNVKGPYIMSPEYRDLVSLAEHLQRPELLRQACKIAIGRMRNECYHVKLVAIVYEENIRSVNPIVPRIIEAWHGLDIRVDRRNGGFAYSTVKSFLVERENRI